MALEKLAMLQNLMIYEIIRQNIDGTNYSVYS
jgi:hypothetical protein